MAHGHQRIFITLAATLLVSTFAGAQAQQHSDAVYQGDRRLDLFQIDDQNVRRLADSTVSVFDVTNLTPTSDGYTISTEPMERTMHVCHDEKFAGQPTPADCSGVLISPTRILTAGHCVSRQTCGSTAFVFGYAIQAPGAVPNHFLNSSVFFCEHVVSRSNTDHLDYAVVELDREVTGHASVPIAQEPIEPGESVYLLSHPAGTPLKYSPPTKVLSTTKNHFSAEIDALGGSSGGPIFSTDRHELVGILVSGADDYVDDTVNHCRRINECAPGQCEGEESTHVGAALADLSINSRRQR